MSCFTTGDKITEKVQHGTNKPPPPGRVQERSKYDTTCPTISQNLHWHPSWLNKACTTRKDSELEWQAEDNPETNPITIKPLQAMWPSSSPGFLYPILLLSAWAALPSKISCFVNTCVSSDDSFLSVRQEPTFRPWKGSPLLQQNESVHEHSCLAVRKKFVFLLNHIKNIHS